MICGILLQIISPNIKQNYKIGVNNARQQPSVLLTKRKYQKDDLEVRKLRFFRTVCIGG